MTSPTSSPQYQPDALEVRKNRIGLCLSGGGYRAALFHLGALRRLNEVGLLSKAHTVSSVSGGSIVNGQLAKVWTQLQPDDHGVFVNFAEQVEQPVRVFCGRNIRNYPLVWGRLNPLNWWRFLWKGDSATNLLADQYVRYLVGDLTLQHLTNVQNQGGPNFIFCASSLQTGTGFKFDAESIGDWVVGYTPGRRLPLAVAIAASSAFPLAFPPLVLHLSPEERFRHGHLNNHDGKAFRQDLFLTDGGVYDNFGLEPVWKRHEVIFCSDGGMPFHQNPRPSRWLLGRLVRSQAVVGNQALAVRKRWLMSSYINKVYQGCYWGLGTDIAKYHVDVHGYRDETLDLIRKVRTDLDSFSEGEQLVLMNHGWALAKAALLRHYDNAPNVPGTPPDEDLLTDTAAANRAIRFSSLHFALCRQMRSWLT